MATKIGQPSQEDGQESMTGERGLRVTVVTKGKTDREKKTD